MADPIPRNEMEASDKIEQLFLLEVLIDKVCLNDIPPDTPIRLRVKFIEFPCFEITEQDLNKDDNPDTYGVTNFNSGKSFLFPMVPLELIRNLQRHPLAVTVFQVKEDAPLLPEIVGQTRVRMSEGMSEAVFSAMSCRCDSELPVSHTLTDTFSLRNMGDEVGTISLFIRLSCFGQSIVTQFQLMGEKKAFLFKNSKADNSFKCKKSDSERDDGGEPTKFDVLPVAPFLTSEENVFDMYSPTGDVADSTVAWKVTPPTPAPCPVCETRPGCNPPPKCPPKPPVGKPCPVKKPCSNKAPQRSCPPCGPKQPPKPTCDQRPNESGNPCNICGSNPVPKPTKKPCTICGSNPVPTPPTNPCNICGSNPVPKPTKKPCTICGSNPVPTPPKNPCNICGTVPDPIPPKPTCGMTPMRSEPEMDDNVPACGAFRDSFDLETSQKSFVCPFCGTTEPPNEQTKICSICGTACPQDEQTKSCQVCGTRCPFIVKPMECSVCGSTCPGNKVAGPRPPNKPRSQECPCDSEVDMDNELSANPPVRYDTTGALSPAFMGWGSKNGVCAKCQCNDVEPTPIRVDPTTPPVRYDTTGALSPAFMGWGSSGDIGTNCKCENDEPTTGAMSPAFMGWGSGGNAADDCECQDDEPLNVPVRYDTTGALSPAFMGWGSSGDGADDCTCEDEPPNPPVRYDTTGALSPAFMGWPEKPPEPLPPSPYCRCGGEEGGDAARHSGQGDGGQDGDGFFATSPVWQTGSAPDVMQGGDDNLTPEEREKSRADGKVEQLKRKKRRTKWTHKWGLQYPGIKFGHRHCCEERRQVPPQMGWLWNNPSVGHKYHKGWRPGALGYTISKMINQHRQASGRPPLGAKSKSKWKSGRGGKGGRHNGPQPPTLHIHRREGAYYISMHPLDLGPDAVNVPLQFKIPKRERGEGDDESSSSSEESELEIEFMAPGAFEMKEPPPEFRNFGTQYFDEDTNMPKDPSAQKVDKADKKKKKRGSSKGSKKGKKGNQRGS